jgi:hypothetical protein
MNPTPPPSPERELLLAGENLAAALHPGRKLISVTVHLVAAGGELVDVTVTNPKPSRGRPRLASAVLTVLQASTVPMRSKLIAKAIDHAPGSRLRQTIRNLVIDGEVVKIKGGYWLASRQQPETQKPQKRPRRPPASPETHNPEKEPLP